MSSDDALSALASSLIDGEAFLAALGQPARRAVRLHPRRLRPGRETIVLGANVPVPWSPSGRFTADDADPGATLAYHTGAAYPQDAASQVPVQLLAPQPGEILIDTCAAPGSKSTQIGLALQRAGRDDGLLVCCDASDQRRRVLAENLARQGVASAVVTPLPVHRLAERSPGCADGVLVDAPCSGHERRSTRQVARMALRQGELLATAAALVRRGGRLVYSTCTPYEAENEGVIATFCANHREWSIEAVQVGTDLPGVDPDLHHGGAVRLWPQRQRSEPFFAVRLRRAGDEPASRMLTGNAPDLESLPWLPGSYAWKRGTTWFIGSPQAAACALPTEARGLVVAHGERLETWGAQGLIERGALTVSVSHAQALALWAGDELAEALPGNSLVSTEDGMPLGQMTADGRRLSMPSRMRRGGLH
jgi:16S rRNA C967 or C1407 C5-methylase (RsmB/RsmF family)